MSQKDMLTEKSGAKMDPLWNFLDKRFNFLNV